MKYKKAGFDIQNYLITFLLFVGVMITFSTIAVEMGNNYQTIGGATVDEDFVTTYEQLGEITSTTEDIEDKVVETTTGTSDASSQFLGDALNSLKLIVPSMSASRTMIEAMAIKMGVPPIWMQIATTALIIMIMTTIIFMIFKSTGKA